MTPLQNLFSYIRDLYNTSDTCYDFEKDTSNPKTEETNFWEISKLILLARQFEQKQLQDFSLAIENNLNPLDYLLKIKRIAIPTEPKIPLEVTEWIEINRGTTIPILAVKQEFEKLEQFEQSVQRQEDLEKYKLQSQSALFEIPIPTSLVGWIEILDKKILRKSEKKVKTKLVELPEILKITNDFQKSFSSYYQTYELQIKANRIYDALHTLHYELKGKENKKLYISFGLVCGLIGNQEYKNFLFNVPLKLSLKNQEFKLEFDTFSSKIFCEQFFVDILENHFKNENVLVIEQKKKEVLLLVDRFNSQQNEFLFDSDFIRTEYYDKGLEILSVFTQKQYAFYNGQELNYNFQDSLIESQITFSFSPCIQTKITNTTSNISKDANSIINKINELQANGNLQQIPDFFKKLFSIELLNTIVPQEMEEPNFENLNNERNPTQHQNSTHRSLFPLPYNDEQFEIAKRLNEQDAVTVKGPPGTGKSHTIANLISHFVAQGKSILVVSHNAKALSVLKDKLPSGIKELAVSLVNEGKGNDSLKASVNSIIRNLSKRYEENKVIDLEFQLTELENKYADTLNKIYKVVQANTVSLKIFNPITNEIQNKTAYEWAVFNFDQSNYKTQFLKDIISYNTDTEGLTQKLVELAIIGSSLKKDDFELVNYQFINDSDFIDINELRKIEIKLKEIGYNINPEEYKDLQLDYFDEIFIKAIESFESIHSNFKNSSLPNVIYKHTNYNLALLKNLIAQNNELRNQIWLAENRLLSYQIDISPIEDTDPDILHQQINQLIVKFGDSKTINWFTKSTLDKQLKRFFDCKLNFISVSEVEQLKIIEIEINRQKCIKQLSITFNNYLNSFGITKQVNINETLKDLDFTIVFSEGVITFNSHLKEKKLPPISLTASDLEDKIRYIKNVSYYVDYKNISNLLENTNRKLLSFPKSHPLIHKIAGAIQSVDKAVYEVCLEEYRNNRDKQSKSIEFDKLFREITKHLPQTALFIKNECLSNGSIIVNKEEVKSDIFYFKLNSFLSFVTSQTKGSDKLLGNLKSLKDGIEKHTADLISYKTWFNKANKVSDEQKSALIAWLNSLTAIGRGFTKNNASNMAAAIKSMQAAKNAVPIWIMTHNTAINFFPDTTPSQFDLLIIDEASQCDISYLNLIFRAKKSLIVGDENQTSVYVDNTKFLISRTNELLDKYLVSYELRNQFNINNNNCSIYNISGVIYPNIVTLSEHFRCLPEIIGYSNKYIYNSDIVPLKTATEKTFGEPIQVHYVEDNYLDESKPLIVQKIIDEIESFIIEFQEQRLKRLPTVGILTLDSSNLKHQSLLIRQISQNELIKQYEDKLELLIGTSREFQGDERDIMFMTITASHSINERNGRFDIRPPRSAGDEMYMRIFNVAASRAKEKSVVIHSIHPDGVALMNPECYRKKLIDYYANIQNQTNSPFAVRNLQTLLNQTDVNSGDFEKSVCKLLYNKGFGDNLYPQFEIGKYCIDFGLIINNKKLAIECDGFTYHSGIVKIQEDINRQLILERAGWRFFRIQSTDWFYRNSTISSDLLQWIADNTTA